MTLSSVLAGALATGRLLVTVRIRTRPAYRGDTRRAPREAQGRAVCDRAHAGADHSAFDLPRTPLVDENDCHASRPAPHPPLRPRPDRPRPGRRPARRLR